MEYPRYTTYRRGELDAELRRHVQPGADPLPANVEEIARGVIGANGSVPRSQIVKSHSGFTVAYPDGSQGTCDYRRFGPAFHQFDFKDREGASLPRQWHTQRLDGTVADIERAGKEIAEAAFRDAIERERREYFCRASESPTGKKRPERYRLSAKRARELAGRYALCVLLPGSGALIPMGPETFEKLEEANTAWRERQDQKLVVGCCNRLDRCWEMPKYNPLYKEFHPRERRARKEDHSEEGGINAVHGGQEA